MPPKKRTNRVSIGANLCCFSKADTLGRPFDGLVDPAGAGHGSEGYRFGDGQRSPHALQRECYSFLVA